MLDDLKPFFLEVRFLHWLPLRSIVCIYRMDSDYNRNSSCANVLGANGDLNRSNYSKIFGKRQSGLESRPSKYHLEKRNTIALYFKRGAISLSKKRYASKLKRSFQTKFGSSAKFIRARTSVEYRSARTQRVERGNEINRESRSTRASIDLFQV